LLTAITGAAATEIGGLTSASVFKYTRRTDHASFKDFKFFQDTRLSVIDEISFAAYHSVLVKISDNLKEFTECQKYIYGKHDICFLGDFCQLEAIGRGCIYKNRNGIYWEQALNMVKLKGTHRFNDCNNMKTIMPNMRDGVLSTEERNTLNSCVINENEVKKPNPLNTKYATYYNTKRSDINVSVFRNYLKKYHNVNLGVDILYTVIVIKAAATGPKATPPVIRSAESYFERMSRIGCKKGHESNVCSTVVSILRM
jgi:hypothetical protein